MPLHVAILSMKKEATVHDDRLLCILQTVYSAIETIVLIK